MVKSFPGRFRIVALCAGKNLEVLARQVEEFQPELVCIGSEENREPFERILACRGLRSGTKVLAGREGRIEAATHAAVDAVVSASSGVTGLLATYEAVRAGKRVALANKEALVVAGEIIMREAAANGAEVLPVDSEHCAIHQCLRSGTPREVERLILTGSGGPFLKTPLKRFASITPEAALKHPIWKMGGRITIDSATLMNKGLEIIEARWLFGLGPERIEVLIHPESIIHSMVEFTDRCVLAQLAVADMRIPIQYALTYPERSASDGDSLKLDLTGVSTLHFRPPDTKRFPCLALGREAIVQGGGVPCALNAADEVAVGAFLSGALSFPAIPTVIEKVMRRAPRANVGSIEDILACDHDARIWAAEAVREGSGA